LNGREKRKEKRKEKREKRKEKRREEKRRGEERRGENYFDGIFLSSCSAATSLLLKDITQGNESWK